MEMENRNLNELEKLLRAVVKENKELLYRKGEELFPVNFQEKANFMLDVVLNLISDLCADVAGNDPQIFEENSTQILKFLSQNFSEMLARGRRALNVCH
jgi:hypothetical protein